MRRHKILFILFAVIALGFGRSARCFGDGVTVNFQNSSLPAMNNLSSFPSSEASSAQVAAFINALRSALTEASSNLSGADANENRLASPAQKYNAFMGPSPIELFDTDEQITKGLILPAVFSALPENESLLPDAEPYSVTICLSFNDLPMPACSGTTTEEAARKLAENLLDAHFKRTARRPFRIMMPAAMPMDQQKQLLYQIESQAIALIEARAFPDEEKLQTYDAIARQEAQTGTNWSKTLKENTFLYHYHPREGFITLTSQVNE